MLLHVTETVVMPLNGWWLVTLEWEQLRNFYLAGVCVTVSVNTE